MHWLEWHWYRRTPVSLALLPLSWIYCAAIRIRRQLYRRRMFPAVALPVPVVVVGNITVGGSGKTPLVAWLATYLRGKGRRPGIVLRGYGGSAAEWPQDVTPVHDPDVVGDEAVMLARQSECPVAADPDRARAAHYLVRHHRCDVVLSDDGLQHWRLARDFEIAVIDGARRFGNGYCLPAGPLREPVGRLHEVGLRVTQGTPQPGELGMTLVETALCRVNAPETYATPGAFRGERVHAVAGIGHPERFFAHLRRLGMEVIAHPFRDHHRYSPRDLDFRDNRPVIMTQKDAVKCERFAGDHVWYLAVEARPDTRVGDAVWQAIKEKRHG